MNKTLLGLTAILLSIPAVYGKKPLDHSVFDSWKGVRNHDFSLNGEWGAYNVDPQEGDGMLYLYNTRTGKSISLERGYNPKFSADGKWAAASIKPLFADTRKAKIDKKKDFDLPQDSLAIIDLATGKIEKIGGVIGFSMAEKGGDWIAYQSCDTTFISHKALKEKEAGRPLVVRNLAGSRQKVLPFSKNYVFSKDGRRLAYTVKKMKDDSITVNRAAYLLLPDTMERILDTGKFFYGIPAFSDAGSRLAFVASADTLESGTLKGELFYVDLDKGDIPTLYDLKFSTGNGIHYQRPRTEDKEGMEKWRELVKQSNGKDLFLNQYSEPRFSRDGRRLTVGVAPVVAPDDTTIVDFERADLDIWRWDAPYTPPQEKKMLKKLTHHSYPVLIDLASGDKRLLTRSELATVHEPDEWVADWALITDPTDLIVSHQWDYTAREDISLVNLNTGETRNLGKHAKENPELSPAGKYVIWFEDRDYHVYDIAADKTRNISTDVPLPLWDADDDHPMESSPVGVAAWSKDDNLVLVYDKFDIWALDPKGVRQPVNLTAGDGKKKNLTYRYVNTDPEKRFVADGDELLLSVFDNTDKRNGLAILKFGKPAAPAVKDLDTFMFTQIRKAKEAPVYSWAKSNFEVIPEIWVSRGTDFKKSRKLSDVNAQKEDYFWGSARLEKWRTYSGKEAEGVLYVPEDFDPDKKYPMLCVFYERGSQDLYFHYTMQPSWSWVNYPFYVSRGYVIFQPDIFYTAGVPGECAYDYVCSGAEEMCKRYPWIDKERIGIDGQSWGGYQTAYLVTRTDMFACAGSGAPVANMTSAFGGIRWGTGDSRQGQYEQGQSRIGRNLWDAPELYIANSPVFHANRVNTPLLIMHNDNDGAVPWYQGIELFMALRRLQKPVWMLNYNGEEHNLLERRNRKDITIRLQQFFDHYLMGAPMPRWMKQGIPMTRKGQEMGTEIDD